MVLSLCARGHVFTLSLTALIPLHCNLFICPLATLDHEPFEIRDILDLFESQALGVAYERYTTHR